MVSFLWNKDCFGLIVWSSYGSQYFQRKFSCDVYLQSHVCLSPTTIPKLSSQKIRVGYMTNRSVLVFVYTSTWILHLHNSINFVTLTLCLNLLMAAYQMKNRKQDSQILLPKSQAQIHLRYYCCFRKLKFFPNLWANISSSKSRGFWCVLIRSEENVIWLKIKRIRDYSEYLYASYESRISCAVCGW